MRTFRGELEGSTNWLGEGERPKTRDAMDSQEILCNGRSCFWLRSGERYREHVSPFPFSALSFPGFRSQTEQTGFPGFGAESYPYTLRYDLSTLAL